MQPFDTRIHQVIEKFAYPMWFIVRDKTSVCPCTDFTTKTPIHDCKTCLGTGYKIKIYHAKAARVNDKIRLRGEGIGFTEVNPGPVFYTRENIGIAEGDIVVDRDEATIVKDVFSEHSNQNNSVYWKIGTVPLKNHKTDFKENLYKYLKEVKTT